MSMLIGGYDLVLTTPRACFDARVLLDLLSDFWPHAFIEPAETEGIRRLRDLIESKEPFDFTEFFVYRDEVAAQSWEEEGRTDDNGDAIVHFLIRDETEHEAVRITIVLHAMTPETTELFGAFSSAMREGPARKTKVRYEAALKAAGCSLTQREFKKLIDEVRRSEWPEWSQDELACHPRSALRFWDRAPEGPGSGAG